MEKFQATYQQVVAYVSDKVNEGLEQVKKADRGQVNAVMNQAQRTIKHYAHTASDFIQQLPADLLETIKKTTTYAFVGMCVSVSAFSAPLTFTVAFLAATLFPKHLKAFNNYLMQQWNRLDNPANPTDHTAKILIGGCLAAIALPPLAAAWVGQQLPNWLLGKTPEQVLTVEEAIYDEGSMNDIDAANLTENLLNTRPEQESSPTHDETITDFLFQGQGE